MIFVVIHCVCGSQCGIVDEVVSDTIDSIFVAGGQ
jgi:hypothetical protein